MPGLLPSKPWTIMNHRLIEERENVIDIYTLRPSSFTNADEHHDFFDVQRLLMTIYQLLEETTQEEQDPVRQRYC